MSNIFEGKNYRQKLLLRILVLYCISQLCIIACFIYLNRAKAAKAEDSNVMGLFSVGSADSSAVYGSNSSAPNVEGIAVKLSVGDKFVYNEPINLSQMSSNNPLIEICVTPNEIGKADFGQLFITLTDSYDENNKVTISVRESPAADTIAYYLAAAEGQPLTGYDGTSLHINDGWGQWGHLSYKGLTSGVITSIERNLVCLSYDYKTSCVCLYGNGPIGVFADLDNPDYFFTPWSGFTTGDVKLSITADSYYSSQASFVITKLANQDLTRKNFIDTTSPDIIVDYGEYSEENIPQALVGKSYPIFQAKGADSCDGYLKTSASVYINYFSNQKINVSSKNGMFTPTMSGKYYIVYTSTDLSSNYATKVVEVNAVAQSEPIEINFIDLPDELNAGSILSMPETTVSGGIGNVNSYVYITYNGEKCETTDGKLRVTKGGKYIVVAEATDYVGQTKKIEQTVSVVAANAPVFFKNPMVNKYFYLGRSYVLPKLVAYDYSDLSGKEVSTKVYEEFMGQKKLIENEYVPNKEGDVKIIYEANNGKGVSTSEFAAKVIDVGESKNLHIEKFFNLNGFNTTVDKSLKFSASIDASAEFTNLISLISTQLQFKVKTTDANFKNLNVFITNYYDSSKVLKFTYEVSGKKLIFYVNDNKENAKSLSYTFTGNENLLKYEVESGIVEPDGTSGIRLSANEYLDGTPIDINFFKKGYISFSIENVKGNSAVYISKLNGQAITTITKDLFEPGIFASSEIIGDKEINTSFLLKAATVADVLDPNVISYVTVTGPDGKTVTSSEGILLNKVSPEKDYTLKFDSYGVYKIIYYAKDSNGNENLNTGYIINVIDEIAPRITVNGKIPEKAQVKQSIYIPSFNVEDNLSKECRTYIFVVNTNGLLTEIKGDGFIPEVKGIYYVRYVAIDEAGNMTINQYKINVSM